jgi:hypothetical protein
MKKSNLRKIIRESIKQLMTEQGNLRFTSSPFNPSKEDLERARKFATKQDKPQQDTPTEPTPISKPLEEELMGVCNNTPQGNCAEQWMSPTLANAFLPTLHACTGSHTFEGLYTRQNNWVLINIDFVVWGNLWSNTWGPGAGPMSWGGINAFVNTYAIQAGMSGGDRGRLKRKWWKAGWSRCMGATWAYGQSTNADGMWVGGSCDC